MHEPITEKTQVTWTCPRCHTVIALTYANAEGLELESMMDGIEFHMDRQSPECFLESVSITLTTEQIFVFDLVP